MRVRCLVSRMIGDEHYVAGQDYDLSPEQAQKYADRGDFAILPEPVTKRRSAPEDKQRTAPKNKRDDAAGDRAGWNTSDGRVVSLSGDTLGRWDGVEDDD